MKRFLCWTLSGLAVFSAFAIGLSQIYAQTYYTNSWCHLQPACKQDGVCQQVGGNCANGLPYTQKKNTSFQVGACMPFASYLCLTSAPQTSCITNYYWNSPGCAAGDIICPATTTTGTKCSIVSQ
jgi:hypothetical protein